MRDRPVLLAGIVGREQAVVSAIANLLQSLRDDFAESLLVTHLIYQFMRADEDAGTSQRGQAEDLACSSLSLAPL